MPEQLAGQEPTLEAVAPCPLEVAGPASIVLEREHSGVVVVVVLRRPVVLRMELGPAHIVVPVAGCSCSRQEEQQEQQQEVALRTWVAEPEVIRHGDCW